MDMIRIRIPELLSEKVPTAYAIANASNERISLSSAHRLVRKRGIVQRYDADLIEALLEIFGVTIGELFEVTKKRERAKK